MLIALLVLVGLILAVLLFGAPAVRDILLWIIGIPAVLLGLSMLAEATGIDLALLLKVAFFAFVAIVIIYAIRLSQRRK